jgi:IMP cyclohydrolase
MILILTSHMSCDIYTFLLRQFIFMCKDFSILRAKEYPGRLIIIGRDLPDENTIIVYAITGRSPSSQARRINVSTDGIWVKPTDEKILREGNRDLLIYPTILFDHGIAVSNGRQTKDIKDHLSPILSPTDILASALLHWEYEPDAPSFTPRISGCVIPDGRSALSIIKRAEDGSSSRHYFNVPIRPGQGKMISTYSGQNTDPLPSFCGDPEDTKLIYRTAEETAKAVYSALAPSKKDQDFRVAVVCVFSGEQTAADLNISVINRSEIIQNE